MTTKTELVKARLRGGKFYKLKMALPPRGDHIVIFDENKHETTKIPVDLPVNTILAMNKELTDSDLDMQHLSDFSILEKYIK